MQVPLNIKGRGPKTPQTTRVHEPGGPKEYDQSVV